ncbi:hypothetical protein ANO14919_073050 [Xylariales sp. No.14919]|nr:hypothetical protein ANO14919_073050 [Xylariales sp. No.14919]
MPRHCIFYRLAVLLSIIVACKGAATLADTLTSQSTVLPANLTCRSLPSDNDWPSPETWRELNQTVGGRLITGVPLGAPCYLPKYDQAACAKLQNEWTAVTPFLEDPVNIVASLWQNSSCNPLFGPNGTCELGNLASYAINISSSEDAVAAVKFASQNNIRLTIKNTGHDYLGRSTGQGSLALWTHNLKDVSFINYTDGGYSGPAVRVGAGVQGSELLAKAAAVGYRVIVGECATVGVAGGYTQGGGHSALGARYGLAADQVLQWEVVTADGQTLTVSPTTEHADLFWALGGGGPGNFAVVLSMTVKAYPDGPVAGGSFSFNNTDHATFWAAVSTWLKYTLILDSIPGFNSAWSITAQNFQLVYATLPDASAADMADALGPVIAEIEALNSTVVTKTILVHPNYMQSYDAFLPQGYTTNNTLGGRLIPRSLVQTNVSALVAVMQAIAAGPTPWQINCVASNVTHLRIGNSPASNAVLSAWRDSLFTVNFGVGWPETAKWDTLQLQERLLNEWQAMLREITPGGGTYMNEATFDNPTWKEDYFGRNYDALLLVKKKYDPASLFWANAAVGSDRSWIMASDGRLCRPQEY